MKQIDNRQKQMTQSKAQKPHHDVKGPLKDKHVAVPHSEHGEETSKEVTEPVHSGPKIGRNDPCPCGSGKKYKKCCLGTQKQ